MKKIYIPAHIEQIWERLSGEPALWYERFRIYLELGPNRSLRQAYLISRGDKAKEGKAELPLSAPNSWRRASYQYQWEARVNAYDYEQTSSKRQELVEIRERAAIARLEEVMNGDNPVQARLAAEALLQWAKHFSREADASLERKPPRIRVIDFEHNPGEEWEKE